MKRLACAAGLALAMHLLAGLAMLFILRRGLETNADLADRLHFIASHRASWTAAWLCWTAAGPTILFFYWCLSRAHDLRAPWNRAALLTIPAIALDWSAQRIEISTLPPLAAARDSTLFLVMHRLAVLLTGGAANALYTAAALLLVIGTRNEYRKEIVGAGYGVAAFGLCLSAAAAAGSASGMFWANAGLVPCLLVWLAGIGLTAWRRAG